MNIAVKIVAWILVICHLAKRYFLYLKSRRMDRIKFVGDRIVKVKRGQKVIFSIVDEPEYFEEIKSRNKLAMPPPTIPEPPRPSYNLSGVEKETIKALLKHAGLNINNLREEQFKLDRERNKLFVFNVGGPEKLIEYDISFIAKIYREKLIEERMKYPMGLLIHPDYIEKESFNQLVRFSHRKK